MAAKPVGIEVEGSISNNLFIEFGKNLSTMIDETCRYAHDSVKPHEMIIENGDFKIIIRVNH